MSSPFKSQALKRRKGAIDLAIDAAVAQAEKLQEGKKLPVGKKLKSGQLGVRLLVPATKKQEQEIREMMDQEWQQLESQWKEAESRILNNIGKILGKEVRKI